MTDREWLIWYRNWLCNQHNAHLPIPSRKVVDAIDEQLGVTTQRSADQLLRDVGRPDKQAVYNAIADQRPEWVAEHQLLTKKYNFWRCAHHPSAIDNHFDGRGLCDSGCNYGPTWHSNGMSERREIDSECRLRT